VRNKPVARIRRSGALLVAAMIAFVGAVPLAGVRWALAPILLIPLLAVVWAWRAGTDVYPDALRVRALVGSTVVPWARITELAPDRQGRISALLDNGNVIRLTGVTRDNVSTLIAAGGQQMSTDPSVPVDDEVDQGTAGDEPA
jgi:Bacterial PH domain